MFTEIHNALQFAKMLPVQSLADLAYLVKESEIMTGQPGRTFVIAGADRLVYRILWLATGFQVQRLDGHGNHRCTLTLLPGEFQVHNLGEALRAGQLFTPPLGR